MIPSRVHRQLAVALATGAVAGMPASSAVAGKDAHAYDSGVRGVITIAGRCPGYPQEGPPLGGCKGRPLKATVRVLKACDRHEVLRFTSRKKDGHYRARLKPGRYVLVPLDNNAGYYNGDTGEIHIRVRKHRFVHRHIRYYNGEA
jgi:hypothetical protein